MKSTKRKEKIIGISVIGCSIALAASLLGVYLNSYFEQKRLEEEIKLAQEELEDAFNLSEKLQDDEYYQIYTPNGNYLITNDGKIVIDFGK